MECKIRPYDITAHDLPFSDKSELCLHFVLPQGFGRRSHNIEIYIEEQKDRSEEKVWPRIVIGLNRNEALYIKHILSAFINEKDIDITEED